MKYTEQAVETLDDAGSVIANKNIEIEQLRQRVQELELLCDVSEDWWKRQSGGLFIDAGAALSRAREMHLAEASQREAA